MARAILEILGDASSAKRAAKETSAVYRRLDGDMKQLAVSAQTSAAAQVKASLHKTERLRSEIVAYREIGAAARAGSAEQIAAANLAARAEQRLATSFGVSSHEARQLSRSTAGAERGLGHATRGALAGSGVFRGLGRSIAFASGGFLAFASGGQFIRSSIDAAKDALVVQRQLGTQLRNDGLSFKDLRGEIDKTGLRISALSGFTKDDLDAALTTILRSTRNVGKALRDEGTAADLARARHISLSQAALILGKTEAKNTTLLRRQGFQISKNATVEQALAIVRRKIAGQARAGTTEQERFGAVLHDSEVIIGTGLLPTLNRYLASGAKWLSQMNTSGRLQKDVATASDDVRSAIAGVRDVLSPVVTGLRLLGKISGGTENEVALLGTAFLVLKTRAALIKWGLIQGGILRTGTAATIATGEVEVLSTRLLALRTLGPIIVPVGLAYFFTKFGAKNAFKAGINPVKSLGPDVAADVVNPLTGELKGTSADNEAMRRRRAPRGFQPGSYGRGLSTPANPGGFLPALPKTTTSAVAGSTPRRFSLQGRLNLLELRKANAEQTNNQKLVRAILVSEEAIVKAQEASATKLKDRTAFATQLAGIMGEVRSIDQASASAAKQAAQETKRRREEERKRIADRLQARQFRALGLDANGSPLTPAVKTLRRELGTVGDAISGTFLDTNKTRSVLAKIRRVLSGGVGAVTKDVRAQIKSMLDDIDQELKDHSTGPRTKFQKANTRKLLAGLGLDPDEFKAVRARLSQLGAGGTIPGTGGPGAFGALPSGSGDVVVPITFQLDGRTVATSTTRHQVRGRRRNPKQRRGFAGSR